MKKLLTVLGLITFSVLAHAQPAAPDDYKAGLAPLPESRNSDADLKLGTIELFKRDTTKSCSTHDIVYRDYALYMGDTSCNNDEVYSFKIRNALKGNTIKLGSDKPVKESDYSYCPEKDWLFYLEVTSDNLTTSQIQIKDLKSVDNGKDVSPGLKMRKNHYSGGNIDGKLSCVDTNHR